MKKIGYSSFQELIKDEHRWVDVRAPIEFAAGSVPGAINLPLLNDEERHLIGLTYKNQGQQAAIELGHQLVSGQVREERIEAWVSALREQSGAVVYCFRGGLRSQIVQSWLKESGVEVPIVEGGYKAIRRYLIDFLENQISKFQFQVVTGPTGSGKTKYLYESGKPFLDLEKIARHRGSAFGGLEAPQPNQVDFENALALELIRLAEVSNEILVEDESRMIGRCCLPEGLFNKMQGSPKIQLEVDLETRVENIFQDYVLHSSLGLRGDLEQFRSYRASIAAISKRLGGLRTSEILNDLEVAQREFETKKSLDENRIWIRKLLLWYYDPVYKKPPSH